MANENGAPDRIRTYDLLIRSQALYPAELRVRATPKVTVFDGVIQGGKGRRTRDEGTRNKGTY